MEPARNDADVNRAMERLRFCIGRGLNMVSRDLHEVRVHIARIRQIRRGRFMSRRVFRDIAAQLSSIQEAYSRLIRQTHEAIAAVRRDGVDIRSLNVMVQITAACQVAHQRHIVLMENFHNRLERY